MSRGDAGRLEDGGADGKLLVGVLGFGQKAFEEALPQTYRKGLFAIGVMGLSVLMQAV